MTAFSEDVVAALSAPLTREHVKQRDQAGRKVSYIEGWLVIAEANRIFGFGGWDRETVDVKCVVERETKIGQAQRDGWRVGYIGKVRITIKTEVGIVTREGSGYGSGIDVDLGAAHESALKECETDATKRSLMTFGNPFGLALYDKEQTNVEAPARPTAPSPPPTLSQIRNAIVHAIDIADSAERVDGIIRVHTNDLALIKEASAGTYNDLMSRAAHKKSSLGAIGVVARETEPSRPVA